MANSLKQTRAISHEMPGSLQKRLILERVVGIAPGFAGNFFSRASNVSLSARARATVCDHVSASYKVTLVFVFEHGSQRSQCLPFSIAKDAPWCQCECRPCLRCSLTEVATRKSFFSVWFVRCLIRWTLIQVRILQKKEFPESCIQKSTNPDRRTVHPNLQYLNGE